MRHGLLSPLAAVSMVALMAAGPVRAESFDLFGFLKPQPQQQVAAEPIAEDAVAPLPQVRPAALPAPVQTASARTAPVRATASAPAAAAADDTVAPLPEPQMYGAAPAPAAPAPAVPAPSVAAAPQAVPLPTPRPAIAVEAPELLLLSLPAPKADVAQRVAAAPVAVTPQPAPVAPPVPQAGPLVPPTTGNGISFPQARIEPPQMPGVEPRPIRIVAVPGTGRPAPVQQAEAPKAAVAKVEASKTEASKIEPTRVSTIKVAPVKVEPAPTGAQAQTAKAEPAKAEPAAAVQPAPVAPVAPRRVADVPASAPLAYASAADQDETLIDPMPQMLGETPSRGMSPEAMSAIILAQTESAGLKAIETLTAAKDAASPEAQRIARAEAGTAALQRIPTVTSAIAGIVSAVSPTSANAATGATPQDATPAGAPAAAAPPAAPVTVQRSQVSNAPPPYEMVRRLQRLQDRIANGDTDALQNQRALIAEIEQSFATAEPHVWQDPRNARAAVIFFLSGGGPTELRKLLQMRPLPAVDERLLQGALAYVEGRQDDAERYLSEINALHLPDALGGQIAMAQAAVTVGKDPKKAMAMLDIARLMMPGTLVEEAALRREILVAAQLGETKAFEQLSRQYLFRFRHSVYAGNFRQRFAAALTRMDFVNKPEHFPRLVQLLRPLDRESRVEIYLMVARGALNQGKLQAAHLAADKVLAEAPALSSDAERARVYRSAVRAASSKDVEVALAELRGAVRSRLPAEDVALLDAAITTAELVKSAADTVKVAVASAKAPPKPDPMKLTVPVSGTPALLPRWPAGGTEAPKVVAENAPPAAPAAAAGQPAPAPLFDNGSSGSALVSRAQGAMSNVDTLLKEAPR
ncbi:hypothetical protein ACLBXM_18770 [Xanthobacteraceae bacterium A53D]